MKGAFVGGLIADEDFQFLPGIRGVPGGFDRLLLKKNRALGEPVVLRQLVDEDDLVAVAG